MEITKRFPGEELYSSTDQIRRSSRSVYSNVEAAWRKRIYQATSIAKINDVEGKAAETQTWLDFCISRDYISRETIQKLYRT